MNHMKEVAEMLGVELGEEFKVVDCGIPQGSIYKLTSDGLVILDGDDMNYPALLTRLLNGLADVVKLPWQPDEGENFYFCHYHSATGNYAVCSTMFFHEHNKIHRKTGNYFRTREEAEAHLLAYKAWLEGESITDWKNKE